MTPEAAKALLEQARTLRAALLLQHAREHAEEVRAFCGSLRGFVEKAWPILEPSTRYVGGWVIDTMCDLLERVTAGQIQYLLINVPPGFMKSLLLVFWTAWEWGPCGRRDLSYLATSYSADNLDRDADRVRKLVGSEWYRALWPEVALRRDRNAIHLFELTSGGSYDSRPFRSMTGGRADRTKIDDPHSVDGAESDVERARTIRTFREGISDRLNDLTRSAMVVIMQRVHEGDVSGVLMELDIGFVHLCLPMEYDPDRHCEIVLDGEVIFSDPRHEPGELLFAERFPQAELGRLRRIKGEYAWASQYQQRPTPRDGGFFQPDEMPIFEHQPNDIIRWVRAWDLAASLTGDWTVGMLVGLRPNKKLFISDVRRERFTPEKRDALIRRTAEEDGHDVYISIPKDPAQAGKSLAIHHVGMLAGYKVEATPELGNKENRAEPVASQVNIGNISMLRAGWNRALTEEMRNFPNGRHDDQVDALSRAFKNLVLGAPKSFIAMPLIVTGARAAP